VVVLVALGTGFEVVLVAFDADLGLGSPSAKIAGVASTMASRAIRVILFVMICSFVKFY
jgi:hypothetical protein